MAEIRSTSDIGRLRSRWTPAQTNIINERLAKGAIDAGTDLRGIRLLNPVNGHTFKNVDFSFCTADVMGQFLKVTLEGCGFCGAELGNTNFWADASICDFSNARFHVLNGRYEDCSFAGADLTKLNQRGLTFVRCDFRHANFRKATLVSCIFDHCTWGDNKFRSGSLCGSTFIGDRPSPVSLGNTMLDDVIFK